MISLDILTLDNRLVEVERIECQLLGLDEKNPEIVLQHIRMVAEPFGVAAATLESAEERTRSHRNIRLQARLKELAGRTNPTANVH